MATDLGSVSLGDSSVTTVLAAGGGGGGGGGGFRFGSMIPVYGGGGGASPWTYADGRWTNAYVQVGNRFLGGSFPAVEGANYAHVRLDESASGDSVTVSSSSSASGDIVFFVGTVAGGRQTLGIYSVPVVFLWS